MADDHLPIVRALLLGAVGGAMAGLFGVGGGIILVPGLVMFAAMSQHAAHATSLAAIIVTAPAALLPFVLAGEVEWSAGGALTVGAVLGAVAGADVMRRIPADRLGMLFGALMLLTAIRLAVPGGEGSAGHAVELGAVALLALFGVGLLTGVLSALMGVGGGILMVPVMVVAFGFSQHLAEGTSLAVIVPTAIVGAWRHGRSGYTRWRAGLLVGTGGVAGGLVGGFLAQLLPASVLQPAFALLLFASGIRLLRSAVGRRRQGEAVPQAETSGDLGL